MAIRTCIPLPSQASCKPHPASLPQFSGLCPLSRRLTDDHKFSPALSCTDAGVDIHSRQEIRSVVKTVPGFGGRLPLESLQQPSVAHLNGPQHLVRLEARDSPRGLGRGLQIAMCSLTTASAASRARCSTEQQTIQNPVVTKSPTQARQKENLPKLDDGGPGGGPGRGDGGGGGGGGGGGWAGGFFFWGLLMMAGFIKDKEKEKPYRHNAITKSKLKQMRQRQME